MFNPNRCCINFRTLHSYNQIILYLLLFFIK
ncbi:DUF6122 family protein [Lutibacter flavus]|nr:DUF6122 family protein [Lutibacter flavus]